MQLLKRFLNEEDGLGTVELVLLLSALVAVALVFKGQIKGFIDTKLSPIFSGADTSI